MPLFYRLTHTRPTPRGWAARLSGFLLALALLLAGPLRAQYAYVTSFYENNVSVIQTSDNTVVDTIAVGTYPYGLAVSPGGSRVYVANLGSNTVSVIQTLDNTVVATVPVGDGPISVAVSPDGSRLYVTNQNSGTVSVLQTSDNTVVANITVGAYPNGVAVSSDGSRLYVTNGGSFNVSVIQTSDNTVIATVDLGSNINDVAVSPDGSRLYVPTPSFGTLSVIQTSDNTVVASVPMNSSYGVAVSPDGSRVYVANPLDNTVSVVRTSDNTIVATVPVGLGPIRVAVSPDGSRLYVVNSYNNQDRSVSVVQTSDNTVIATVIVGFGPVGVALAPAAPTACTALPTPTVAGAPLCAGQALTLTVPTACATGLTAQLSDKNGSFASPMSLGTVTVGSNQVVLHQNTPFGTGYRIRLVSSSPALTSEASAPFTVNALGAVSVALYPATPSRLCQGEALPVTFSTTGACPFPVSNTFTVQLSNATGSFANPTTLGTASPGTTPFALPPNLPAGTGYRVRILTSNPATTSQPSAPFELRLPSLASLTPGVSGVPTGGVCRGTNVTLSFTLPAGSCVFPGSNPFTAQLSGPTGSFASPVSLGVVQAGVANPVTIPAGSAAGTGYRIRVLSSDPVATSLASLPFRVNACPTRMSAEEPQLVVMPNPVVGGEIRVRVGGLDNPQFGLTTPGGRSVGISVKTDGSGEWVLIPRQALPAGVYTLAASEGAQRLVGRVVVVE
jgi:YVTN family beta-propeller protein